jgi:hypothetical protein
MAHARGGEEMYCDKKKQNVPKNGEACDKFKYDILKRHVRRMKKLNTNFSKEDFTL